MKKLLLMLFVGVISVSVIVGCGGGGGGGVVPITDPETVFPLIAPGADVPGYQITGNLSGTVTVDGISYDTSVTFNHRTRDLVFLNDFGVNTMPADTLLTIDTPQLNLILSVLGTIYFNAESGNNEPVFMEDNDGNTATPIVIHLPPAVGQVGDFGELTSWAYNDGSTATGTWSLESSTPGFANLVEIEELYDSLDNLISTAKATTRINEMGEPVHITYFQNVLTEGVVFNFSGNIN